MSEPSTGAYCGKLDALKLATHRFWRDMECMRQQHQLARRELVVGFEDRIEATAQGACRHYEGEGERGREPFFGAAQHAKMRVPADGLIPSWLEVGALPPAINEKLLQ